MVDEYGDEVEGRQRGRTLVLLRSIKGHLEGGLGIILALGLIDWAEHPTLTSTSTPRSSWQADRTLTLLRTVVGVLGLAFGAGAGAGAELGLVLVIALGFGLVLGDHHAWLACTIAVTRLALERWLPWRVMDFLDDVYRLGLLRMVGPV